MQGRDLSPRVGRNDAWAGDPQPLATILGRRSDGNKDDIKANLRGLAVMVTELGFTVAGLVRCLDGLGLIEDLLLVF